MHRIKQKLNIHTCNSIYASYLYGFSQNNIIGPYFVEDSLSEYWGTVYAMNLNGYSQIINNPPLVYDSISVEGKIISANQNSPFASMVLGINNTMFSDSSYISFSIKNAFAFVGSSDPAGDNAITNSDSTEADGLYSLGEKFNDYGDDNCPNKWETGNNENPCDSLLSLYNPIGTEGNGQLDWIDNNYNNLWDDGEGEKWTDWGKDGCSDKFEFGADSCLINENPDWVEGSDFNVDNFIIDPSGDDWNAETNPDSSEGNGFYDLGEPFKDWGSDGLHWSLVGWADNDGTEGNMIYDFGEPFDDTGIDGKFNINEFGHNSDGTEGNNLFDYGGEFSDCGEDNICLMMVRKMIIILIQIMMIGLEVILPL